MRQVLSVVKPDNQGDGAKLALEAGYPLLRVGFFGVVAGDRVLRVGFFGVAAD